MYIYYIMQYAGHWSHFVVRQLQMMGRGVHNKRALVAGLLVLQFSAQCSSQLLPVLPLNRFGTKNTYNNTFYKQRESASPNVEETEFCCPPVQVYELSVVYWFIHVDY